MLRILIVSLFLLSPGAWAQSEDANLCADDTTVLDIILTKTNAGARPINLFSVSRPGRNKLDELKLVRLGELANTSAYHLLRKGVPAADVEKLQTICSILKLKFPEYTTAEVKTQPLSAFPLSKATQAALNVWETEKVSALLELSDDDIQLGAKESGGDPAAVLREIHQFKAQWGLN